MRLNARLFTCGGEGEIRTPGRGLADTRFPIVLLRPSRTPLHSGASPTHDFQSCALCRLGHLSIQGLRRHTISNRAPYAGSDTSPFRGFADTRFPIVLLMPARTPQERRSLPESTGFGKSAAVFPAGQFAVILRQASFFAPVMDRRVHSLRENLAFLV